MRDYISKLVKLLFVCTVCCLYVYYVCLFFLSLLSFLLLSSAYMFHVTLVCLYHTVHTPSLHTPHLHAQHMLSYHVPCNLLLRGHCYYTIRMVPWYICIHSEALLWGMTAVSMVTTAVVAVSLKSLS